MSHFLRWCWTALGWPVERQTDGSDWLQLPPEVRERFEGRDRIRILDDDAERIPESWSTTSLQSPLFDVTTREMRRLGEAVHAAPACQPTSVHELTPRLFDAYVVDGGHVLLGGCILEDHPLVRSTCLIRSAEDDRPLRLEQHFATIDGQPVDSKLVNSLRVDDLAALHRPPRLPPGELASWISATRKRPPRTAENERCELLLVTVVWCKYFHCKLIFEIGDARAELPFSSWAQWLIDGDVSPPPFHCPHTNRESFRLVRTDDGRVTVPEAVAVCQYSGRRVLETSLATCEVTGRRVLNEFLDACPISGQRVLISEMVTCEMCGQRVGPKSVARGQCQACRSLQAIDRDDPRMARIFGEHPKLEQWSRWQLSETATVYILRGSSFFRRLLAILDRDSLDPLRLAEGTFLSRRWTPLAPEQWGEYLQ